MTEERGFILGDATTKSDMHGYHHGKESACNRRYEEGFVLCRAARNGNEVNHALKRPAGRI